LSKTHKNNDECNHILMSKMIKRRLILLNNNTELMTIKIEAKIPLNDEEND